MKLIEMNVKDMVNTLGTLTDQIRSLEMAADIASAVKEEVPITMTCKQCKGVIESLEQFRDILADRADSTMIYF